MGMETKITVELIKGAFSLLKAALSKMGESPNNEIKIESHIKECISWSSNLQFFGIPDACDLDSNSIKLDITSMPRKFRGPASCTENICEEDILCLNKSFIILGGPGSGKTTTIKRLVRLLVMSPPLSENDVYQYPLVIRLRELKNNESLLFYISKLLGLKIREESMEEEVEDEHGEIRKFKYTLHYIGDVLIEDAIPTILDETRAIVFIDGLDEVSRSHRNLIEKQLMVIVRKVIQSKIILSCRSGDYSSHIEGFSVVELCDLTNEQVNDIAYKWADSPADFIEKLSKVPYFDLSNRPLLLTQLILLFNRRGYLPEQAIDIYDQMINLLLEEWDANRKIRRKSKYSSFSPVRKKKFLSALAYELTFKIKTKRFNAKDLHAPFLKIYKKFDLDKNEANIVIEEIESHTGLIINSGYSFYEFSHLSLQEYLCACYLVGSPKKKNVSIYLEEYPAPLAISIALSPESTYWFSMVILADFEECERSCNNIIILIDRVELEGVIFEECAIFGQSLLKLLHLSRESSNKLFSDVVCKFIDNDVAINSLVKELRFYTIDEENSSADAAFLSRRCGLLHEYEFTEIKKISIDKNILNNLLHRGLLKIEKNYYEDNIGYLS